MASFVPRALAFLITASILCGGALGQAQSSPAAQALFDEGVSLRNAGKMEQACSKFEESLRLESTVGTRFNLADCFERLGRLASAWSHFLQVASDTERAGEQDRAQAARARASKLEPRLCKMVIKPAQPHDGMVVKRDGMMVGQAQWATALPIDAGPHQVEASAPGKRPWQQTVTISGEGKLVTVNIPALDDAPAGSQQLPPPGPGGQPMPPPGGDTTPSSTPMILGLTIGAVGVAGIVVGAAFGVIALNKKGEVDDLCPDLNNCTDQGIAVNDEAKTAATISTIGFIAGGALLVTGIVLWVALPSETGPQTGIELTPTGAWLRGRF
jgi:hypothetical protein